MCEQQSALTQELKEAHNKTQNVKAELKIQNQQMKTFSDNLDNEFKRVEELNSQKEKLKIENFNQEAELSKLKEQLRVESENLQ